MFRRYSIFLAAACVASAQDSISGPFLGFFLDSQAQAVRKIWGIPGSATAGENLDLGFPVGKAVFSPAQDYAFVVGVDGSVNLILLGKAAGAIQSVTTLPPAPDRIVLSAAARAAAFMYGTSIKILTGLPDSLDRIEQVDTSALPGVPAALAISDDGAVLLASFPGDTQTSSPGGVFVFSRGDSGPRLVAGSTASGVSFLSDSHDALIVDEAQNSVTALQDAGGAATTQWVFVDDRLPAPRLARGSLDGRRILLASSTNKTVALLDRETRNPVFIPCTCSPSEIEPLSGSVYQITESGNGPIWILDLTSDPRLFFVPVPQPPGDPASDPLE